MGYGLRQGDDQEMVAVDGPGGLVVLIDRSACIGAGDCVAAAPLAFRVDADRRVRFVAPADEAADRIWSAARRCPTDAILLEDADGTSLYP